MKLSKMFLMHAAGSVYEIITGQSHTQRLIKRKVSNVIGLLALKTPKRSWEDGRTNTEYRACMPTAEESDRLNEQAARSI